MADKAIPVMGATKYLEINSHCIREIQCKKQKLAAHRKHGFGAATFVDQSGINLKGDH